MDFKCKSPESTVERLATLTCYSQDKMMMFCLELTRSLSAKFEKSLSIAHTEMGESHLPVLVSGKQIHVFDNCVH